MGNMISTHVLIRNATLATISKKISFCLAEQLPNHSLHILYAMLELPKPKGL